MEPLVFEPRLLLSKTQFTSDIMSKIRILFKKIWVDICWENRISDERILKSHSAKKCKMGNPLGFLKLQFFLQNIKKNWMGLFGDIKNFRKNEKREIWSLLVPKNVKGGPFGLFPHPFSCKISIKMEGRPFGDNKKISNKSLTKPKRGGESLIVPRNWKGEPSPLQWFPISCSRLWMRWKSITKYFWWNCDKYKLD